MVARECVILAAGEGKRMGIDRPKCLLEIGGETLLARTVNIWKRYVEHFIVVVGYQYELVAEELGRINVRHERVLQEERRGISHALSLVKNKVHSPFLVVLGDCYYNGAFVLPTWKGDNGLGVSVYSPEKETKKNYAVLLDNDRVTEVREKPTGEIGQCGMGVYYLSSKVFEYIDKYGLELTDTIQRMLDGGIIFKPIIFKGQYVNINYAEDLDKIGPDIGVEII